MLPPQTLYIATIRRVRQIAVMLARALHITGPFNVQFLARHNAVKVIECNLRASRSFPFVSKVIGENFAAEATRRMLGVSREIVNEPGLDYVGVKAPMFSFSRLAGQIRCSAWKCSSTGGVGFLGRDLHEALLHGLRATGMRFRARACCSHWVPWPTSTGLPMRRGSSRTSCSCPSTQRAAQPKCSARSGSLARPSRKFRTGVSGLDVIEQGRVDFVINVVREYDQFGRPDVYWIRRQAVDLGVPLITDLPLARAIVEALRWRKPSRLEVLALDDYVGSRLDTDSRS